MAERWQRAADALYDALTEALPLIQFRAERGEDVRAENALALADGKE